MIVTGDTTIVMFLFELITINNGNLTTHLYLSSQMIRDEGLEKLTALELQNANVDRGMRSVGVSVERLRNQLDQVLRRLGGQPTFC